MGENIPVSSLRAAAYVIPTDAPEADGTLAWDTTTLVVVHVAAGDQTGTGWTYCDAAAVPLLTGMLAGVVTGKDVLDVPAINAAMHRAVRNVGGCGIAAMAISAVDIALWDLKARLLGIALSRLLGRPGPVAIYGSGGFTSYDSQQLKDQLSGWVDGLEIPRVKIKIGESRGGKQARDLRRIEEARAVIGADAELYVDANGGYTTLQAADVAARMAAFGVTWFEEPVSSDDVTGLASLRAQVEPDVAAGEYCWNVTDAARLVSAGAVDCLQLDVTRCGGITGFQRAALLAEAHGLQVSGHCAPNLHAHAAASIANLRHVEYFHDHQRIEQLFFDGALRPVRGMLTPDPGVPGTGLELRAADAEHYLTAGAI
jgi:L-alanine-DL-glutamate epimerase-like enolase superfamily enzyme